MNKSRPSQQKRQRERQRQERRKEKQAKRQEVAAQKANNPVARCGVDPDLEGIQAGPQPLQDWQTEIRTDPKLVRDQKLDRERDCGTMAAARARLASTGFGM